MTVIKWEPRFELGIPLIDEQHKVLVHLINEMESILITGEKAQYSTIFTELVKYTRFHFTAEESLMLASGFDIEDINAHIKQHKLFIEELSIVCEDTSMVTEGELQIILSFLNNWLTNHICKVDKKLATHIEKSPDHACLQEKKKTSNSELPKIDIDYRSLMAYFHESIKSAENDIKAVLFGTTKVDKAESDRQIEAALKKISLVRKAIGRLSLSR